MENYDVESSEIQIYLRLVLQKKADQPKALRLATA